MKHSIKSWLVLTSAVTLLSGCFGNKGSEGGGGDGATIQPLNINETNLAGAWELESITVQGQTRPANFDSRAQQNGYTGSYQIRQLSIEGSGLYDILSDEQAIQWVRYGTFTIQNQIITTNGNGLTSNYQILNLTASTLKVLELRKRPAAGWSDPNQNVVEELNFVRIPKDRLATSRLQGTPLAFKYKLSSSHNMIQDEVSSTFPWGRGQTPLRINCEYNASRGDLTIHFEKFRQTRQDSGLIQESAIKVEGSTRFNFGSASESTSMNIRGQGNKLSGLISLRDGSLTISSGRDTTCDVSLQRNQRKLSFQGLCQQVRAASRDNYPERGLRLEFSGNCLVSF